MDTILITGAASGIGAATARLFHRQGWRVGLLDINAEPLEALADTLSESWWQACDVTDRAACERALTAFAESNGGRLRVLFNCAGVLRFGHFESTPAEEHARILAINVLGLIQLTQAALPYLKACPGSQVINMGSASGLYGTPHMVSYSASKFAVRGFTEALELEWRRHGIHVGDLMPPFVATPMVASQAFHPPALRRLGLHLDANVIARACWAQVRRRRVHRPVSLQFKLMYWAGQISPPALTRWVMGLITRE